MSGEISVVCDKDFECFLSSTNEMSNTRLRFRFHDYKLMTDGRKTKYVLI